jgi:L,D-transpeptidase YcbB
MGFMKSGGLISYIIFFSISLSFTSCEKQKITVPDELSLNEKLGFNEAEYNRALNESFAEVQLTSEFNDTLVLFYEQRNFRPLFIKSFEEEDLVYDVLNILARAEEHGLDPELYNFTAIKDHFIKAIDSASSNRYSHLSMTERLITDAVIKFSYHLRYGAVNPKEIFPDSYYLPLPDSSSRDIFMPLKHDDVMTYLREIQPSSQRYFKLQSALKEYSKYIGQEWEPIHFTKKKLEIGVRDTTVHLVADRLLALGLLDTSVTPVEDFTLYDSVITASVKDFQKMHGLNADGVIGGVTLQRLNYTPENYVNKIKASLERFRWTDYTTKPQYIHVNIPDFNLYIYENGEVKFNSKVCTGIRRPAGFDAQQAIYKKTKNWRHRPDDWETPAMYGEISYMVLNPTWTVPVNIIREEIVREVRKDSSYLERKNFRIYKDGNEIAAASVRPQELTTGTSSYRIVQGPGSQNALGRIKFMFNNPFGIYLHDTPSRAPFNLDNRAVSHGCVRVEKPLGLSEYLLQNQSKWNIDYLKIEVGAGTENEFMKAEYREKRSELRRNTSYGNTTDVKFDKKIPLYIDYYTAWVDDEGIVNFRDDVYKKDIKLLEKLADYNKRNTP